MQNTFIIRTILTIITIDASILALLANNGKINSWVIVFLIASWITSRIKA